MTDEKFDQMMRQALPPLSAEDRLLRKTKMKMEESEMNRTKVRKVLMTAATCGVMWAIAVGAVSQMRTGTIRRSRNDSQLDYGQLSEVKKKIGYDCKVPQMLPGGYEFSNMSVSEEEAVGEGNILLRKYNGLIVEYQDKGDDSVMVSITQQADEEWGFDGKTEITGNAGEIDGIPIDISVNRYRLVPPNYQLSEEEKVAVDTGELIISYGSDEVRDITIGSVNFVIDGILYCITDMNQVSESQLFEIAKAIIEN